MPPRPIVLPLPGQASMSCNDCGTVWADYDTHCPRCGVDSDPNVQIAQQADKMVTGVKPLLDSDVDHPVGLSEKELEAFSQAVAVIVRNAADNAAKRPKMTTLMEEVAKAILASRGKHDDPLELEISQIGGLCINMLWQMATGADVANLKTRRPDDDNK